LPALRLRDVDGIFPLAAGCLLLAYIEGVSAARSFATKYGYELDPRQEFLGLGAANLAAALGHGYPVAGGLSQSAVNDKAGARTPLALIFASLTLAVSLLFLTGFLQNLPKAVLAAVVFTAVLGLVDIRTLSRMWRISKADFYAATIALAAVLLLGILQGILLAAAASVLILLARASQPHVAFLGRIPGTSSYSDLARHPENEQLPHVIVFRPEASLLYVNAEFVSQTVLERLTRIGKASVRTVVCDLSASPYIDLAGSRMLRLLYTELAASGIALRILGARGRVRDLLRADGLGDIVSDRGTKLETVVDSSA
jgi:MFS superfamily sulfate permease-like transporter